MALLCNLQNISLAFGEKILFQNCHFEINHGERIGLLGGNGRGKTTLFKILTGEVVPDLSSPKFLFDKSTGDGDPQKEFSVFHIPQELPLPEKPISIRDYIFIFYPQLNEIHTKLREISMAIENSEGDLDRLMDQQEKGYQQLEQLDGWKLQALYESYLKYFRLPDLGREFISLSGGEQRKIALALGLSSSANLLLWDEPSNHLDIETIRKFERELISLGKAFIVITHDRYLLNNTVNKIFHIQNFEILPYIGTYSDYLDHLTSAEKLLQSQTARLQNILRRETDWMRQGIKARGTRSKKRVENYNDLKKEIGTLKSRVHKSSELDLIHSGRQTKKLCEFKNISFAYDDNMIVNDLSFLIAKKDKIGLLGPNGVGKSTLLKLIEDKLTPSSGNIKRADQLKVISFDQKREELDPEKTPFEIIGEGQDFVHMPNGNKKHVASYLEKFLFRAQELNRPISSFSGGEKNRLQLAKFMKHSADLWIFDEPTNDLDLETLQILEDELKNYDAAVILVCHDRAFLDSVVDKVWLMNDRKLEVFQGGYSQVAPYLEAIDLAREAAAAELLEKPIAPNNERIESKQTSKIKLSNKEKMRWKVIDKEIESMEELVMSLEEQIEKFDYQSRGAEELEKYSTNLQEAQKGLDQLYEEWSELDEKINSKD